MSKYIYIGIFGFFGGIVFGSFFQFGYWVIVSVVVFSSLILVVSQVSFRGKIFFGNLFFPLIFLSFVLGVFRMEFSRTQADSIFKNIFNKQTILEGVVIDEPDIRENSTHLVFHVLREQQEGKEWKIFSRPENVLLIVKRYPEFKYGDKIIARGKLMRPENFENKNGREFDYVSYLEKDGIFSEMNFPNIEVVSHREGNTIISSLFDIKQAFLSRISQVLSEPHASLLGGILVGAKHSLGKELENDFRTAGVIHIIVLSGYNITLVAYFFMNVFSFLPPRFRVAFGVASIFLFTIMTGAGAATVRASIMAGLILFARATGRTADLLHLLFVAGFFMVLWNPHILLHDPSFQLSFLATLGLLLLSEKISMRLVFIPKRFFLREITAATLSTQIFVLPLLLYQTGQLSLVALPANLFILPAISGTMFFGFLSGTANFISIDIGSVFGFIAYFFLEYILRAVNFFSHLPFASIAVPEFPVQMLLVAYFFFGLFVWHQHKKTQTPPSEES